MPNYPTILFDLDGTLIDTKPGVLWSVRNALRDLNMPIPGDEQLTTFMGPPIKLCFTEVCGVDEKHVDRAISIFRSYYESEGLYNCSVYPGVVQLLDKLKKSGFILGVATSKAEKFAKVVLKDKNIALFFDTIAGTPENDHNATKKDSILRALASLGLRRQEFDKAVLIGDRKFDAEGAASAGIDSIGVTYGYGSSEEIKTSFKSSVTTPEELFDLLNH